MFHRFPRIFRPAALSALALTCLSSCSKNEDTIKIGEYASISGKDASLGHSSHRGTVLAVETINAAGGLLGKPIQLIPEDTQSKAGESGTAVRKLSSRDKVVALLGEVASSRS